MWEMIKGWISLANVLSLLRAALMAIGAGLATQGGLDPSQIEAAIGYILGLVSIVWSYFEHKPKPPVPPAA